jgi:hypothetical protein
VSAEGDVGTTARYRLTARALGRDWTGTAAEPAPARVRAPAPVEPARAPVAAAPTDDRGMQLVIGGASVTLAPGARFEIGEGVSARLEIGPDGELRMVVRPPER